MDYSQCRLRPYTRGMRGCQHLCTSCTAIHDFHFSLYDRYYPLYSLFNESEVPSPCILGRTRSPRGTPLCLSLVADSFMVYRYPVCVFTFSIQARPGDGKVRQVRCPFRAPWLRYDTGDRFTTFWDPVLVSTVKVRVFTVLSAPPAARFLALASRSFFSLLLFSSEELH